jgi:ACS family hexuronate transporter-like MFS transporter
MLPRKWQICVMLLLATTLNYLDRQTLSILAPTLQKDLHLDNEALGWLFAVFYYTYTFAQMVVGPILDRANIRWALVCAVLLWSTVSALTALANGFATLLIARLMLGIVEAANWPAALRIVVRILEPPERALGNGIFTSGTSIAALVAPGLILGLAAYFGWRLAFVLVGSLGALWVVGWIFMTRGRQTAHVWREPAPPGTAGIAGQLRIFRSIIGNPRFRPVLAVAVLVNPCLYFSVNWLPVYFVQERGFSSGRHMGWVLTAIYLGLDLGNLACGAGILALTRNGRSAQSARRIVFILATLCMIWCAAVPILPTTGAVIALILFNFGQGIWTTISLTFSQEISATHVATAIGLISGCGSLVGALAMWAVGRITRETSSFTIPLIAVGVTAIIAAVAGWTASRNLEPGAQALS